MSAEVKKEIELEIAHVLFLDIVGYSKLSVNEQHGRVDELNGVVRLSEQFQKAEAANRILKIPTGDGMALVFYKSPEEPAQCAFEISRRLKDNQRLQVRMGVHSGPVSGVVDVNERTNVVGAGINLAQRVMDCGDAGHILLSRHVTEDLAEYERWRPFLHDIGTFEVKHGVRVSVTNLYSDEVGNPKLPKKLEAVKKHRAHVRWAEVAIGLLVLGAIVAAFMIVSRRPATSLTGIPEKSIAVLPFVNMSEDKANEYFSDGISEELLNLLAKIPQLQVTARTSSFAFTGKETGIPEIARTLHVAHVPRDARAWDGLATNMANEAGQGLMPSKEGDAQAREADMKALAIDPDDAPAHAGLGWIAMDGDNDLAGAAQHFRRALALDPADLDVLRNSVMLLAALGRLDESLALNQALVRRDPVNVNTLFNLGLFQRRAGRLDAAIASQRTVLSLAPGRGGAHAQLATTLLLKGDAQGALAEIEQETSENWKLIGLPMAYHALGRKADSDAALTALIAKYEKDGPYNIAYVYAYRGDADKAFEWLDKAVEYGDPGLADIVTENLFAKIHADPRWLAFLRKIGKAPEQLAKIEFKVTQPQ